MVRGIFDNIDQFVVETVFEDNGAIKGFTMLEQKQRQVMANNAKITKINKEVSKSGFALGSAFRFFTAYLVGKDFLHSIASMDSLNASFEALAGSAEAGRSELQFLREESERLGLNFLRTADSYKNLFAAVKGAGLGGDFARSIFSNLMEAATVLQLTPAATKGALLAIEQMVSKGKVSLEELRRQLGNALPGAMQIAAKAMGVTSKEFEKMISDGMDSVEFLKRFSAQLDKDFGNRWQKGAKSLRSDLNRLQNAIFNLKIALSEGGAIDVVTVSTQSLTKAIKFLSENLKGIALIIGVALLPVIIRAIPILDVFFLNLKAGMGILAAMKFAVIAILPTVADFVLAIWAAVTPLLKIYAVIQLIIQAIKLLKGEDNWFERIGEAMANFWHHGSFDDETPEEREKRLQFVKQQWILKGKMADVVPLGQELSNSPALNPVNPSNYNTNNYNSTNPVNNNKVVNQNITMNINGSQSPLETAKEVENALKNNFALKLALGVLS